MLLLFDAPQAVVLVGISQLVGQATLALRRSPSTGKRMRGARGVLFNTSQLVLATALGSLVYDLLLPHRGPAPLDRVENLWAIPAAALAMHLTNNLAVAVMVGLQLGQRPQAVWLSVWHAPLLERAGLMLIGLVAALGASQYTGAPLVMALPAAILFQLQRRAQDLLASEQVARTAAEHAQSQLVFLGDASAGLAASLDYETTLQTAVRLAVPSLADRAASGSPVARQPAAGLPSRTLRTGGKNDMANCCATFRADRPRRLASNRNCTRWYPSRSLPAGRRSQTRASYSASLDPSRPCSCR